jgi:3-deoxy-D-manno-octulosonic-acid transferase
MFLLYNFILTLLAPFWVPWMLWRASKRKEKPDWKERQGDYDIAPQKGAKRVWLHAVSVGEVIAAMPILRRLREKLPDYEIVLSVTTSSGHQTAREKAAGHFDHLVYFPIDVPRFQAAAMSRVRPAVVAVMETELWFNFLWAAKAFRASTLLVNGRISDRSFPRARLFRFFFKSMLRNVDRCLMQTERDAERILALGAQSAEVLGNCKFDEAVEGLDADPAEWRNKLGLDDRLPVLVVGSTRSENEERLVLDAIAELGLDRLRVIHAPRHLERAEALCASVAERFGSCSRRSLGETGKYLILDTYGELNQVYAVADIVVIGGGFDDLGGQNLIQPLAHGKPVLHGPHMQNFREAADLAQAAGASRVCASSAELARALGELLGDEHALRRMGDSARALVQKNLGAGERYAQEIAHAALNRSRGPGA